LRFFGLLSRRLDDDADSPYLPLAHAHSLPNLERPDGHRSVGMLPALAGVRDSAEVVGQ
jgi:hypothetical protein